MVQRGYRLEGMFSVFVILLLFGGLAVVAETTDPSTGLELSSSYNNEKKQLRVSPVAGGPYGQLRISHVWRRARGVNATTEGFPFRHRWKQFSFDTNVLLAPPESYPKPGGDVRGVMLGDVCISSKFVPCLYGRSYGTLHKITWLLNTLGHQGLDFWAMLGDNLYDEDGSVTELFFSKLSRKTQSVPLIAVPGNHDFWTRGGPSNTPNNQFGFGYAQYYMVDAISSRNKNPRDFPFNFPSESVAVDTIPDDTNFFHYSAIGGVGFIAFSGGHQMDIAKFEKACKYFSSGQPGGEAGFVFLLGHWSAKNLGCQDNMFSAAVHRMMMNTSTSGMDSCYALTKQSRLFYADGHFHENRVLGPFGIRVGGQGMIDTGTFGFPLVQVTNESLNGRAVRRLLVSYIALARFADDPFVNFRFHQLQLCSAVFGVFGCLSKLSFVDTWLNTTSSTPKSR